VAAYRSPPAPPAGTRTRLQPAGVHVQRDELQPTSDHRVDHEHRRRLSRGAAKASAAGTVTVALTLSSGEQRFLRHHPGRRLKITVTLRFTPKHGGRLTSHVTLLMR
jgi:hypothetical protein